MHSLPFCQVDHHRQMAVVWRIEGSTKCDNRSSVSLLFRCSGCVGWPRIANDDGNDYRPDQFDRQDYYTAQACRQRHHDHCSRDRLDCIIHLN
jgi:hypothetical protein